MGSELHRWEIDPEQPPDARQWKALCKLLVAFITNPSINIGDSNSEIVFPPQPAPGKGSGGSSMAAAGAFFTLRVVEGAADPDDNGDIYLQGGQVSGWGTPVDEILIYDASTTTWQGSVGDVLEMTVTGTGAETSGILDPSFTPTAVSTPAASATLGTNSLPSSGDLTGKECHISLGTFYGSGATVGGFSPAFAGNIQVAFCWSGYTISRF